MKINSTKFKGLKILQGKTHLDSRGAFRELFLKNKTQSFQSIFWCMSKSKKNVIRGLHIQKMVNQAKFVSVVKGRIFDVALDLRKNSKTFGKHFAVILSAKNSKSIYIPKGFAHGFCTISDDTRVMYKVDDYYSKDNDTGIKWNDEYLNLKWPFEKNELIISDKDNNLPKWLEIKELTGF